MWHCGGKVDCLSKNGHSSHGLPWYGEGRILGTWGHAPTKRSLRPRWGLHIETITSSSRVKIHDVVEEDAEGGILDIFALILAILSPAQLVPDTCTSENLWGYAQDSLPRIVTLPLPGDPPPSGFSRATPKIMTKNLLSLILISSFNIFELGT